MSQKTTKKKKKKDGYWSSAISLNNVISLVLPTPAVDIKQHLVASSGLRMPRMSRANTPTVSAGNFRPMAYSPGTRDLILRWPEHELATPVPFWRPDTETLATGQHQEETAIW